MRFAVARTSLLTSFQAAKEALKLYDSYEIEEGEVMGLKASVKA